MGLFFFGTPCIYTIKSKRKFKTLGAERVLLYTILMYAINALFWPLNEDRAWYMVYLHVLHLFTFCVFYDK